MALLPYVVFGLALTVLSAIVTTFTIEDVRHRLIIGALAGIAPVIIFAALYYGAAGTGCAGGSCTGSMIFIGLLGVMMAIPTSIGLGVLLSGIIGLGFVGVRRLRERL